MTPLERALRVTNITTEEAADVAAAIKAHAEEAVEAARKVWEDEVLRPAVGDMRERAAKEVSRMVAIGDGRRMTIYANDITGAIRALPVTP